MSRPIGIDLFAGVGGLSLGFEQAGFDVVAAVEIDPIHCAAHHFNFPKTKTICRSVADLSGDDIRTLAKVGKRDVDVVFGGAPCQGFSLIGKRAFDDPRNKLVYHFVRLVMELNPKYFVFENVKGLTVGKHRHFLEEIIAAFQLGGYRVVTDYKVLNAADYGVPQDRKRLFLMGAKDDLILPHYPKPYGLTTVQEAIGDLPNVEKLPALWHRDWEAAEFGKPSIYAAFLRGKKDDPLNYGYTRRFDSSVLTSSLLTVHTDLSKGRFAATRQGDVEPISRFKKLDPNGVCNTLRAGTASDRGAFTSPRPIHPTAARVITVREAARLHSYPDWFRFHVTKWHGFRQVGNSVPPLLARAVASEIIKILGIQPEKPFEKMELGDEDLLGMNMSEAAKKFGVSDSVVAKRHRFEYPTKNILEESVSAA